MNLAWCRISLGLAVALFCSATNAPGQDVLGPPQRGLYGAILPGTDTRVLVLPSVVRRLPPEASRLFREAVAEARPGLVIVDNLTEATDLLQLTHYELQLDELLVQQTWQIAYRPLVEPDEPASARAMPITLVVGGEGRTLSECAQRSRDALRDNLRMVLARFRPYVPR